MASLIRNDSSTKTYFRGLWANDGKGVNNRYLGFRYVVNGKIHFGWARVTITWANTKSNYPIGTLTGYAYETIPNKAIIAGQTKAPNDVVEEPNPVSFTAPAPKPAALGLLALRSPGLSIWRREESAGSAVER